MKEKAKKNGEYKTFLLEVPTEVWEKWKDTVPRSISINKAIIQMLIEEAEKNDK
ncbi:MAG: hypothetical protein ACP5NS_01950 [Candidatus Pacearchaeota archaeon]